MSSNKTRTFVVLGLVIVVVVVAVLLSLVFTVWQSEDDGSDVPVDSGPCDPGDTRDDYIANGTDIVINANLSAYLVEPVGSCRGAVIVIHDIYGYELGATRLIADELATHGYTAIMPDLFRGNPWAGQINYIGWRTSHPQERVDHDVDVTLEYIHTELGRKYAGVVGFCWGGRQTVLASGPSTDRIQVGVGFYGVGISNDEALAMSAPTMLIFAEEDVFQPVDGVYSLEDALEAENRLLDSPTADDSELSGPAAFIRIFEDVGHGFVHRANRSDPVAAAVAEEAKQDMYTWLERYLPVEDDHDENGN
ncbi:carboxymethylenebutenolidase homolog [Glandiceps talaboti]